MYPKHRKPYSTSRKYSVAKRSEKFWFKVNKNGPGGCWDWTAATYNNGYGVFWNGKRNVGAHVFSFLESGHTIRPGNYVCHTCDRPQCVNPAHLFEGTPQQNQRDMFKKGRANKVKLENHPRFKLTDNDIEMIIKDTRSLRVIAKCFDIHQYTVWSIKKGRYYRRPF